MESIAAAAPLCLTVTNGPGTGFTEDKLGNVLPVSFDGCSGFSGRKWPVVTDGVLRRGYYARVDAEGIRVLRHGVTVYFR